MKTTRREFAAGVAAFATGAVAAHAADKLPSTDKTMAELTDQILRLRFGKHLTEEQVQSARQSILRGRQIAEAMKRVPLTGRDEPAFVFQA
jgi:hypothetical protein